MTSSQDALSHLDEAREGIRLALQALDQLPADAVPQVTTDGIQHELLEVAERLQALRDDLAPAGNQASRDER
jgi:hypothetical protein